MTVLDWLFVGGLSTALLCLVIGVFFFILIFGLMKQYTELGKKRPKNKKKKKRWVRTRRKLKNKKNSYIKRSITLLIISASFASGAVYARYYQLTNLSSADGNIIVQSYFITDEVEKSLTSLQNGADVNKTREKLLELSSLLVSYGGTLPENGLSQKGQQMMNRYYVQIREYGVNIYSLSSEQLSEPERITGYLEDLKRIKQTQKKIFKQFSVNESALRQKK